MTVALPTSFAVSSPRSPGRRPLVLATVVTLQAIADAEVPIADGAA
jgi:hypothetical protein